MQRMSADAYRAMTGQPVAVPRVKAADVPVAQYDPECGSGFEGRESALQRACITWLRENGYAVCETSQRRPSQQTIGMPDMFVRIGTRWLGIEVKTATGQLSAEQAELARGGGIMVVRSLNGLIAAVRGGAS